MHRDAIARHLGAKTFELHDLPRRGLAGALNGIPLGAIFQNLVNCQCENQQMRLRDAEIDFGLFLCPVANPEDRQAPRPAIILTAPTTLRPSPGQFEKELKAASQAL